MGKSELRGRKRDPSPRGRCRRRFRGIHAARGLAHLPVDVTVSIARNHHTFQPLLYQVALAVLSPADIAQPIRTILRHQTNTEVLMDEVVGIDVARESRWAAARRRLGLPGAGDRRHAFLLWPRRVGAACAGAEDD